jgi:hypothetical protein
LRFVALRWWSAEQKEKEKGGRRQLRVKYTQMSRALPRPVGQSIRGTRISPLEIKYVADKVGFALFEARVCVGLVIGIAAYLPSTTNRK